MKYLRCSCWRAPRACGITIVIVRIEDYADNIHAQIEDRRNRKYGVKTRHCDELLHTSQDDHVRRGVQLRVVTVYLCDLALIL